MQDLNYSYISACTFSPITKSHYFYGEGTKYSIDNHDESIHTLIKEWRLLALMHEDDMQQFCLFIPVRSRIYYNLDIDLHTRNIFSKQYVFHNDKKYYKDTIITKLLAINDIKYNFKSTNGLVDIEYKDFLSKILFLQTYENEYTTASLMNRKNTTKKILENYISCDIIDSIILELIDPFFYLNDIDVKVSLPNINVEFCVLYTRRGLYFAIPIELFGFGNKLYLEVVLNNSIIFSKELTFNCYTYITGGLGKWTDNISMLKLDIDRAYKNLKQI